MESESPARPRSRGKNTKTDEGLHELHSERADFETRLIDAVRYNDDPKALCKQGFSIV